MIFIFVFLIIVFLMSILADQLLVVIIRVRDDHTLISITVLGWFGYTSKRIQIAGLKVKHELSFCPWLTK